MKEIFDELVQQQKQRLQKCADQILPGLTPDDLMQPNDYPILENHPVFRYEEGVLEGLLTARMAYLAQAKERVST